MIHNVKTENINVQKDDLLSSRVNLTESQRAELLQGLIDQYADKYASDTLNQENDIVINPRLYDDVDRYNQLLRELPEQTVMWDYHTIVSTDIEFEIDYVNKTITLISGSGSDAESDLKLTITRQPIVDVAEFNIITDKKITINLYSDSVEPFHITITDEQNNIIEDSDNTINESVSLVYTDLTYGIFKVIISQNGNTVVDKDLVYLGEDEIFDIQINTTNE